MHETLPAMFLVASQKEAAPVVDRPPHLRSVLAGKVSPASTLRLAGVHSDEQRPQIVVQPREREARHPRESLQQHAALRRQGALQREASATREVNVRDPAIGIGAPLDESRRCEALDEVARGGPGWKTNRTKHSAGSLWSHRFGVQCCVQTRLSEVPAGGVTGKECRNACRSIYANVLRARNLARGAFLASSGSALQAGARNAE